MGNHSEGGVQHRRTLDLTGQTQRPKLPPSPRGLRTRLKLLNAARAVFERQGYLDARLSDITTEAGMSAGSFYTYFDSKEAIFAAVVASVEDEMLHPDMVEVTGSADPVAIIRASNRAYLSSYAKYAKFMRLLNEVSSIDEGFREVRRLRGEAFIKRNARSIADLQERGLADASVDALLASAFLSGMVGRAAYSRFVLGETWDIEDMVETLTTLWVNALKLDETKA